MNVTVYVPKELEQRLAARAKEVGTTPSLLIQRVLREALAPEKGAFSARFAALAGSWEDDREPTAIVADIRRHRAPSRRRAALR